jgi:hypothetical protein
LKDHEKDIVRLSASHDYLFALHRKYFGALFEDVELSEDVEAVVKKVKLAVVKK